MKHDPLQRRPEPASLRGARRCGAKNPDREALPVTGRSWSSQVPYARLWPRRGRTPRGAEWELSAWTAHEAGQGGGWLGAEADARGARSGQGIGQGRVCEVRRLTAHPRLPAQRGGLHIAPPEIIFTPTIFRDSPSNDGDFGSALQGEHGYARVHQAP
jgi:hypothetical protein